MCETLYFIYSEKHLYMAYRKSMQKEAKAINVRVCRRAFINVKHVAVWTTVDEKKKKSSPSIMQP